MEGEHERNFALINLPLLPYSADPKLPTPLQNRNFPRAEGD